MDGRRARRRKGSSHPARAGRGHTGPRGARWLGHDRNPLRRATDRAETAVRLTAAALILTAMPAAGIMAGRRADQAALDWSRGQAAATYPVQAVLLQQAPAASSMDPYPDASVTWVPARWMGPGGPVRSGDVLAPAGAPEGSTVQTWVNESGQMAPAPDPDDHDQVIGGVFVAATLAMLAAACAVLGAAVVICRALDRRRMSAWDTEWRTVAPLWTGRRS